jgi:peptidyl-prolyl cis-trans isomerase C
MDKYWLVGSILVGAMSFNGISIHAEETSAKVLATVNEKTITQQDYNDYVGIPPGAPSQPNQELVINDLVNRELVVQNALKQKLDEDEAFLKVLEKIKYRALFEFAMEKFYEKHPLSDERLREEYNKFKPISQYKIRHILFKSRDDAVATIMEIQQGKDFSQLAMQRSMDPTSRQRGGDLGWLTKEQMFEQIARAIAGMGKGTFTTQPIQTSVGWHVVLLEDMRELPPMQFEATRPQLSAIVRNQMAQKYFEELKQQGKVEINK